MKHTTCVEYRLCNCFQINIQTGLKRPIVINLFICPMTEGGEMPTYSSPFPSGVFSVFELCTFTQGIYKHLESEDSPRVSLTTMN